MICFTRLIFSKSKQRNVALSRRELPTKPTVNFGCGWRSCGRSCFFFNDTATTEIYTLSLHDALPILALEPGRDGLAGERRGHDGQRQDRKSTRLNSSHPSISYAVFCLKKKNNQSPRRKSQLKISGMLITKCTLPRASRSRPSASLFT